MRSVADKKNKKEKVDHSKALFATVFHFFVRQFPTSKLL